MLKMLVLVSEWGAEVVWMIREEKNAGKLIWEAWELLLSTHVSLPNTDAPWDLSYTAVALTFMLPITVVAVTVEPRTWCCFILCFQAQTRVSSSTNGAGCHDSHPGARGIDWLMSLGNGAIGTALGYSANFISYPQAQQLPIKASPLI